MSPQELMPDPAIGRRFYEPDEAEALLRERLEAIRRAAAEAERVANTTLTGAKTKLLPCSKCPRHR